MRVRSATPTSHGALRPTIFTSWWIWTATRAEAARRGIDERRLLFAPRVPPGDHLARHRLADLFLDTWPVCAHTTASDALWAGLPLVTHPGRTFISRVSGSLLTAIGLPELIAPSIAAYEELAVSLARDADALATIRRTLAENRLTHSLFDTKRFCRNLERAFETMWDSAQNGQAPLGFHVEDCMSADAGARNHRAPPPPNRR